MKIGKEKSNLKNDWKTKEGPKYVTIRKEQYVDLN